MDYFGRLKRRAAIVVWVFLILFGLMVFLEPGKQANMLLSGVTLTLMFVLNMVLSLPSLLDRVNPRYFLVLLYAYAILIFGAALSTGGSHSPLLLFFIFPIAFATFYYPLASSLLLASAVTALDATVCLTSTGGMGGLLDHYLLSRILFYFLGAFFIGHSGEELKTELRSEEVKALGLQARTQKFEALIEELKSKNTETLNLCKQMQREIEQKDLLVNISKSLTQTLELRALLAKTLSQIKGLLPFQSGGIFLYNAEKTELYQAAGEGLYEDEMKMQLNPEMGFPGIVAQTNKSMLVGDLEQDPRFRPILRTARINSAIYVPIALDREVYGTICLWSPEKAAYSQSNLETLQSIAQEAARAIKNAELYQILDTRLNFIVGLWETTKNLTSSLDLYSGAWEGVLRESLNTTRYLFGVEQAIFFTYSKIEKELTPYISLGFPEGRQPGFPIQVKEDPVGLSTYLRSSFQIKEILKDQRLPALSALAEKEGFRSVLWAPLIGRERIIGTLALLSRTPRTWAREEIQWLDIFSSMFSMTLENMLLLRDLVSEKTQLQVLIDNMPEGVFTTDASGRLLTWNAAASRITGWSLQAVAAEPCSRFLCCQTVDRVFCNSSCFLRKAMEEGNKIDSGLENIFVLDREGKKIPVFITSAPIWGEKGKIAGSLVVFRDITKEKEIEWMKEDFLATITHDLKSPLASIMGYSELMLNPNLGEVSSIQREFLESILRSCKTLQILVDNILDSTRLEAGQMQYNRVFFNLEELLVEVAGMFRPLVDHKHQSMKIEAPPAIVVFADREKIRSVLINLLSNAVKFTRERGSVTIQVQPKDSYVEVLVSDTGKGIPASELSRLFQKFSQVRGEKRGTGLGLYIVHKILEAQGERISVRSEEGKGTTFTFTISRFATGNGGEIKRPPIVLVAERNRGSGEILVRFLLEERLYPILCLDSECVRACLEEETPDLLIFHMDPQLPGAGELLEDLRSGVLGRDIPIVLIGEFEGAIDAQNIYVLRSPQPEVIVERVRMIVKK